jgi:hypothetical protein
MLVSLLYNAFVRDLLMIYYNKSKIVPTQYTVKYNKQY